jgi:hypothetical protein
MKRAPLYVLAGAVAGFAGVLGFHPRPGGATAAGSSAPGSTAPRLGLPSPAAQRGQRAGAGHGQGPQAGGGGGQPQSATGVLEQYGYGELAVRVTLRGSRIVSVSVPTIRVAEPYSQQLASQVIPMLRSEALASQTARIHGVSGATYTSEAYALSLQSALDKLHFK